MVQLVGPQFQAEKINSVYKVEYIADIFISVLRLSVMLCSTG
jgi:hypothetical protein